MCTNKNGVIHKIKLLYCIVCFDTIALYINGSPHVTLNTHRERLALASSGERSHADRRVALAAQPVQLTAQRRSLPPLRLRVHAALAARPAGPAGNVGPARSAGSTGRARSVLSGAVPRHGRVQSATVLPARQSASAAATHVGAARAAPARAGAPRLAGPYSAHSLYPHTIQYRLY